jgi:hypothetical protein
MTATITVTNNYFQDQATFIAAAGLPKNTKYKKADLYAKIETWNRMQAEWDASEPAVEEIPTNCVEITDTQNFDDLFANWEQTKAQKVSKAKEASIEAEWTSEDDRQVVMYLVADRQNQAAIVSQLRQKHTSQVVGKQLGIDRAEIRRKVNSIAMYESIPEIRSAIDSDISWANFESRVGKILTLFSITL